MSPIAVIFHDGQPYETTNKVYEALLVFLLTCEPDKSRHRWEGDFGEGLRYRDTPKTGEGLR